MAAVLLKSTRLFKWACAFLCFHFSEKSQDLVAGKIYEGIRQGQFHNYLAKRLDDEID